MDINLENYQNLFNSNKFIYNLYYCTNIQRHHYEFIYGYIVENNNLLDFHLSWFNLLAIQYAKGVFLSTYPLKSKNSFSNKEFYLVCT